MEISRENHVDKVKRISSTVLADLGVPMPPGMVLSKSARSVIPIFEDLAMEEWMRIATKHDKIKKKALIAFYIMMLVILLVIVVATTMVSIWKPMSFASLGLGLGLGLGLCWFSIIHCLCSIIYLCWLRKKEQELENYRVEIAELVLEQRKKLPMVAVDNVEADQRANDLINMYCYCATIPLGNILNTLIYGAARNGALLVAFCGVLYWHSCILGIFVFAASWIFFGRSYYQWRKIPVEYPPV